MSPAPSFSSFLADTYPATRARHPGEGRRKWRLRVAEAFWQLSAEDKAACAALDGGARAEHAAYATDDDARDAISGDAPGLGILVRTDFSDEPAWEAFCARLREGEAELAEGPVEDGGVADDRAAGAQPAEDAEMREGGDTDDEDGAPPVFSIVNAAPPERATFADASNLAVLRLLNDVDVRRAPVPPPGTRRITPPNRLVEHDGWQEIYTGKTVWVYDAKSNRDQSAKLVSQQSGVYGTATADSWRTRASHVCELQVNLASGALQIDFGGLDRWDYDERLRNLEEATRPII